MKEPTGHWRVFIAIELPSAVRKSLSDHIQRLRDALPDVHASWSREEHLHLTLKFIGESEKVDAIRESLSAIRSPSVELTFRGAGFFPTARAARVFWVGIESDERLAALASSIDDALVPLGIGKETHAFTPHITLACSGSGGPSRKGSDRKNPIFSGLQKRLDAMPQPDLGTMTAHEFFLYQSKTAPTGAVYTKLADVRTFGPQVLVVDDAGSKEQLVKRLLSLRRSERDILDDAESIAVVSPMPYQAWQPPRSLN